MFINTILQKHRTKSFYLNYIFNFYVLMCTEKQQEDEGVGGSGEEKACEPDICTDDEKQSRLKLGTCLYGPDTDSNIDSLYVHD